MQFFRLLSDWALTRIFWFCVLAGTAQADVILWESPFATWVAMTPIAGGEIRSQAIDLTGPAIAKTISLSLGKPWDSSGTGGPSQISLWLDSTPAERRTLIYSGVVRNSWSGLAIDIPKGRSFLSVENLLGSQTIAWGQNFSGGALRSFKGRIEGVTVPEPELVVLLVICCAAGIFWAWKGRK